jgi:hypothetical protein
MNGRNSRTLHLLAGIVFVSLAVITLRAFLFGDSLYNYRDDYEWFPDLGLKVQDSYTAFNADSARRIISLGPFLTLFNALGLSTLITEKTVFLFTRFIMGFFPYLVVYKFLSSKSSDRGTDRSKIFVVSILSGFFYAYNPLAVQTMGAGVHGFPFSYALIPLIFYFFDKTLNNKDYSYIFITALLISLAIAETAQYLIWLPLFVLVPWFIIILILRTRAHKPVSITIKNSLLVTGIFLLISSYWILMTFSIIFSSGQAPGPGYILTDQMLVSFSSTTSLINAIRLLGAWWPYVELTPIADNSVWIFLTFVTPLVMLLSILTLRDNRAKLYCSSFLLILVLLMFFFKGVQPPVSEFYPLLNSIPLVGWMFRLPERAGMFMPFFVMMIIGLGFQSILNLKVRGILRCVKFVPLVLLVSSISLLSWPMFTGDFGGIYKEDAIWYTQTPPVHLLQNNRYADTSESYGSVSKENTVIIGGYDKAESLNSSGLLDQNKSSFLLGDQLDSHTTSSISPYINKIILGDGYEWLPLQFSDQNSTIILEPFDATTQHFPSVVWSKAQTNDPLHGPFHEYLDAFRITNKDQDYGKGVVFTWAQDKLEIPFEVRADDNYNLYIRYMKNPAGGTLKLYVDNDNRNETKEVSTTDALTKFVWENIGTYNLTKGKHSLVLENSYGFNAVNVFALIPSMEVQVMEDEANSFVDKNKVVHLLDSNSSFYSVNNEDDVLVLPESSGTFIKRLNTVFDVPDNRTQLSVQLRTKQNPDSASHLKINAIEISPIHNKTLFTSNFEDNRQKFQLQDNLGGLVSLSSETEDPIAGNKSLRVDVRKAGLPASGVIQSSDIIPVQENVKLTYRFAISAVDINSLIGKAIYYDEQKRPIKTEVFFGETRNTFEETYPNMLSTTSDASSTPEGTRYVALVIQSTGGTEKDGYYLLDNVEVEQSTNIPSFKNFFDNFENLNPGSQNLTVNRDSLQLDINAGNETEWNRIETTPIPIRENTLYNFTITIQGNNVNSLDSIAQFSTSDIQKDRHTLVLGELPPMSETSTNVKILKNSTYTIATQVKTCPKCTSLLIEIGDTRKEFNLRNDLAENPRWFYFTANLTSGNTPLKVYSDSQTSLYKMILYSDSSENETLNELFTPKRPPAILSYYDKIDPTHYEAKVNATKPFVFKLIDDQEFNNPSLWVAHAKENQYHSIPLYKGAIGFFIEDAGELDIKVEFVPQKWFYLGLIITVITIVGSLIYLVWQRRERLWNAFRIFTEKLTFIIHHFLIIIISRTNETKVGKYVHYVEELRKSVSMRDFDADSRRRPLPLDKEHKEQWLQQENAPNEKRTKFRILSIRTIANTKFPTFLALLLLTYVLFLLVLGNIDMSIQKTVIANQVITYVYVLLLVGAAWQFIRCLGKIH